MPKYSVAPVRSFALADVKTPWSFSSKDGNAILEKGGWKLFKQAHLVTDVTEDEAPEKKDAYTYPVAKLVGGRMTYFFRAASTVYAGLKGGARRADLPGEVETKAMKTVKGIYAKFDKPFAEGNKSTLINLVESARLVEAVEGSEGLEWKIVLIESGMSLNRKLYNPTVLQAALPLFEGLHSYVDHPSKAEVGEARSILDLAGWITDVRWDLDEGEEGAVVGTYHALKSGAVASILREAWERDKLDLVQFSILGEGDQRLRRNPRGGLYYDVESIDQMHSLDAVSKGAAGGRVKALVASVNEEVKELSKIENMTLEELQELRPDLVEQLTPVREPQPEPKVEPKAEIVEPKATPVIEAEKPPQPPAVDKTLAEDLQKVQLALATMECEKLLGESLSGSNLPVPVKDQLREDFTGKVFEAESLYRSVKRAEDLWAKLAHEKPTVLVAGESRVDKLVSATYGMLLGEDVDGVPRFVSPYQAYCTVAGLPFDTPKNVVADSLMRESIGFGASPLRESISWTYVFGTSMERKLIKDYQIPAFDEWRQVVSDITSLTNFKQQEIERIGYYGVLPTVLKSGTYQPLTSPGEVKAYYSPAKKGGLEDWTWEDALNDDLGGLKKIPKRLALAAKITLFQYVFDFLRTGDTTATTYDSVVLFHVATHGNLGTADLSSAALTTAKVSMRGQTALGSTVTFLSTKPKLLVIPAELESLAIQLRDSEYEVGASNVVNANPHRGTFEIVVVDYFTDANRWFLVADPMLVPTIEMGFLNGRQEPELLTMAENVGSAFTADKVVFKVRHVFGGAVVDHRGLYMSESS